MYASDALISCILLTTIFLHTNADYQIHIHNFAAVGMHYCGGEQGSVQVGKVYELIPEQLKQEDNNPVAIYIKGPT